jgi:LuxR family quorum sensing-dependent transcriptional regulator/LuxR family quorum-sensing system transcriptional regulator CciR
MGKAPIDQLGFYNRLREQESLAACASLFKEVIAPHGFVAFACGEIDLADRDRNVMYVAEWPPEWKRYYFESGFVHRDPVINALGVFRNPFTFGDIVRDPRFSNLDREMLRTAATEGWTQGLVVPVARGGTRFGLVSLIGRGEPVSGPLREGLCLMSECLLTHMRVLVDCGEAVLSTAGLSRREIEAVRLVASGCSDGEIAAHLGISESTAHKHVESARRRLKAKSRSEMAAVGVSFALATV